MLTDLTDLDLRFPRDARIPADLAALEGCPMLGSLIACCLDSRARTERSNYIGRLIVEVLTDYAR